jgi:hypothetical protein
MDGMIDGCPYLFSLHDKDFLPTTGNDEYNKQSGVEDTRKREGVVGLSAAVSNALSVFCLQKRRAQDKTIP